MHRRQRAQTVSAAFPQHSRNYVHRRPEDDIEERNLLLALLDRVGVRVDHYGDSTGRVVLEPLAGV